MMASRVLYRKTVQGSIQIDPSQGVRLAFATHLDCVDTMISLVFDAQELLIVRALKLEKVVRLEIQNVLHFYHTHGVHLLVANVALNDAFSPKSFYRPSKLKRSDDQQINRRVS